VGKMMEISANKPVPAYIAYPASEPKGAVIVVHEVWGLVDHIKSVADRLAAEGYIALAPDFLASSSIDTQAIGGMQEALFDPKRRNQIQPVLRKLMAPTQSPEFGKQTTDGLKACFEYLYKLPEVHQKVAVMGFCFGGTYSFSLAVDEPRLKVAIPFYGHSDHDVNSLKQIKSPIYAFYGENDERLVSVLADLRQKMKRAGVNFTDKVYPGCGHAFFNDTNKFAYNPEAAKDAWSQVISILQKSFN